MQPFSPAVSHGNDSYNNNGLSAIAWCQSTQSSEIICTRVQMPRILAAATIRGRRLFCSELPIVQLLFEGGVYSKKYGMFIGGGDNLKVVRLLHNERRCYKA